VRGGDAQTTSCPWKYKCVWGTYVAKIFSLNGGTKNGKKEEKWCGKTNQEGWSS